jgi:hypothetical protein
MKRDSLTHEFVEYIPSELEEGTLYLSIRFRTAVHLCACGCGDKVVTPIKPAKWHLAFDGNTVSLYPSVGSWQSACRSHYWIRSGMVQWAKPWTKEQIEAGRERDASDLRTYYEDRHDQEAKVAAKPLDETAGLLTRVWRRIRRR